MIEKMKNVFDISNPPVLDAFLKLGPWVLPDRDSLSFESYGEEKFKALMISMELLTEIYAKEEWCKLTHFITIFIYITGI